MTIKNVLKASGFFHSRAFFHNRAKVALLGGAVLALAVLSVKPAAGQRSALPTVIGIPEDWSHHHLIIGSPTTAADAEAVQKNPRYWHQWFRRNVKRSPEADLAPGGAAALSSWPPISVEESNRRRERRAGLWGASLTAAGATVGQGNYPAKFAFFNSSDLTTKSCSDFVAANTSLAGNAGSATVTFSNSADSTNGHTIKITNNTTGAILTLTAGSANSGTTWNNSSGSGSTDATNFNTQLNAAGNGSSVQVYATRAGAVVTIHSMLAGAISFSFTENVTNAAVVVTAGSNTAKVVSYTDLYSGCGTVPTLAWQVETGGLVQTSVTLSEAGDQVAFVQSYTNSGTPTTSAQLVLLKPGSSASLVLPAIVSSANYRSCTAPCMTAFELGVDDTTSAPFVDYLGDIIYVGDSNGVLHKFAGVFLGTPTASTTVIMSSANALSSPVVDFSTNTVFVTTGAAGTISRTTTALAAPTESTELSSSGITDAPFVDSQATADGAGTPGSSRVYVFVNNRKAAGSQTSVFQLPDNFLATTSPSSTHADLNSTTTDTFFDGDFDNPFFSNGTPATRTGNLYACAGNTPTLYRLAIGSGTLGAVTTGPALASAAATCSPITEFFDGATDRLFVSVSTAGAWTNCNGGCLYSLSLGTIKTVTANYSSTTNTTTLTATAGTFSASDVGSLVTSNVSGIPTGTTIVSFTDSTHVTMSAAATATRTGATITVDPFFPAVPADAYIPSSGGSSGIVIDNSASGGGTQVYFSYLTQGDLRTIVATENSTKTIVATARTFSPADVGAPISGTGIPIGATIASVTDATHAILSVAATVSASHTLTITTICPPPTSSITLGCLVQAAQSGLN